MLYRVYVFLLWPPFFVCGLYQIGGEIDNTTQRDSSSRQETKRFFFSKEIKCREFASLWSSVCWLSCKFISSKTKNWKTKFKRGEIGWNAIRHRLLPPSLIPLKSYFRRIFFRQVIKNKRKEKFRFLNHRKMCQMVYILNQVCKYLYLSAILCVEKKCFHFPIVILSLCVADFRYTHTNSLRLLLLYTQTSYTHKLSS